MTDKGYETNLLLPRLLGSGDMTVGALADAGADQAAIVQTLESLGIEASFDFVKVKRRGIGATKFRVTVAEARRHRHLPAIVKMIESSASPNRAKARAVAAFEHLGRAEAAVHQAPIEKVHFHEVGAADSIADIVGACVALELLDIDEIVCSPFNVGAGTVETDHGILPIPAPATARLLLDKPIYASGPGVELTTPTGAALACLASNYGPYATDGHPGERLRRGGPRLYRTRECTPRPDRRRV